MRAFIWAIFLALGAASCYIYFKATTPVEVKFGAYTHVQKASATCQSVNGLPDSQCTPGVANPDITQANIEENICNPHWSTKSIRPPTSYTNPLKIKQMGEYGFTDSPSNYEEDHLESLEIGGSPTDPKNLWPEAYSPVPGAREKDKVENQCHKLICSGKLSLTEAQHQIASNWKTACR